MNERSKILESIKKGILSPEEGLDLLESLGLKETEGEGETASQSETNVSSDLEEVPQSENEINIEEPVSFEEKTEFEEQTDFSDAYYQEIDLVEEESNTSEEEAVEETFEQEPEIQILEEAIEEKKQISDSVTSMIDEWENIAEPESKESDPVKSKIDEFDEALQTKVETLREKKEIFRELNLEAELGIISAENEALYKQMKVELKELEEEIELLKHERKAIDEDLFASPERPYVSDGFFEVPKDFEEQKYRPMDRPQVEPNDWASRIGRVVNRAAKTVNDTVNNSDFDWKSINQKFYRTAKTHFTHQFTFEDIDAQTIDIKLAKGKVILKTWENESINDIKVEASVALLGQMDEPDPVDAFLERSRIDVNNYQVLFHVPNKRVDAKLTFYLPKRQYNNLSIRLLNGDLMIEEAMAKNAAIKATSGTILIKALDSSMLEIEGTNNEVEIREGEILDASIETVTGTIISRADTVRAEYSVINGDIKLTAKNDNLKKIEAQSVNGDVKVSLPQAVGIEGSAKTGIGTINYRFANCETMQERNGDTQKILHFQRKAGDSAQIEVSSKAGNIFLKDYDK